jgi:hypothetical protein
MAWRWMVLLTGPGRAGGTVRPPDLVHLPQPPAGGRRRQNVWPKLAGHLDSLRDPAALPGWLATTTQRECGRTLRTAPRSDGAGYALATGIIPRRPRSAGRAGPARGRIARPSVRASGQQPRAASTARPAHRRSGAAVCGDQRLAGHPGRQHRARPPPLPGQAAPPPSHHRPYAQSPICVPRVVIVIGDRRRAERRVGARLFTDTFAWLAAWPPLGYGPTQAGRPYFYAVAPAG